MKNLLRQVMAFVFIFACIFSCGDSFADNNKASAEYTFIIYLNGCDLESGKDAKTNKLNGEASELLKVLQNSSFDDSKLNIIVVTGGTKQWVQTKPVISATQCQAWRILGEPQIRESDKNIRMELVKETDPTMSMLDKNTLSEYLSWIINNYPAKKYALFMWNHGGGPIGGFGTDELNNNVSISISDIKEALKKSLTGTKLELIAFTCCLMGNFETAYMMKDFAKYMVGSEELSYGDAFDGLIKKISDNPSMSGSELGKTLINAHFKDVYDGRLYTFSLIDLSKIDEIRNYWDELIDKLQNKMNGSSMPETYRNLATARAFSESYNERAREADGITDMYHFAQLISQKCSMDNSALLQSIKNAVLYNKVCKARTNSNGMSIYFVDKKLDENLGLQDNLVKYRSNTFSKKYYDFICNYYNKLFVNDPRAIIGNITFSKTNDKLLPGVIEDIAKPDTFPSVYRVRIDPNEIELVNQIWFVIGKIEAAGNDSNFKILSIDKDVDFNTTEGNVTIPVTGKVYCIGGQPVPVYWDGDINRRKDPKYLPIGSFAVKYNGENKFLVVQENNKDSAEIIGAWDTRNFKGSVIPVLSQLDPNDRPKIGDKITILYKALGKYEDGPEVTLDSYTVKKSPLENGGYSGAFYIEDIIGRKVWSYRKGFDLNNDSSGGIKASNGRNSEASVSDEDTL